MKLSVLQENLNRALGLVTEITKHESRLPVLNNVLLATVDGQFQVSATDLETAIVVSVGAMVEETGAITIPAKQLNDSVKNMPETHLDLVTNDKTQCLTVNVMVAYDGHLHNSQSNTFKGLDATEFPILPTVPNANGACLVALDVIPFYDALTACVKATNQHKGKWAGNEYEYVVNLTQTANALTLAATDGSRASHITLGTNSDGEDSNKVSAGAVCNIAVNSSKILVKVLSALKGKGKHGDKREIWYTRNDTHAFFVVHGGEYGFTRVTLSATLQDVKFPDFDIVTDAPIDASFTINSKPLKNAVKMLTSFNHEKVLCTLNGSLWLHAESYETVKISKDKYENEQVYSAKVELVGEDGYTHTGREQAFYVFPKTLASVLTTMNGLVTVGVSDKTLMLTDEKGKTAMVTKS